MKKKGNSNESREKKREIGYEAKKKKKRHVGNNEKQIEKNAKKKESGQ